MSMYMYIFPFSLFITTQQHLRQCFLILPTSVYYTCQFEYSIISQILSSFRKLTRALTSPSSAQNAKFAWQPHLRLATGFLFLNICLPFHI